MKGHKWFAALFDPVFTRRAEQTWMKEIRPRVLAGARGRVLEIGAGTGNSLPYYRGNSYEELVLTEPDPYMMERLRRKLAEAGIEARVVEAPAEELPFPVAYLDTVISTNVLCSVKDLGAVLAEVRRVLKPNGQYRFYEHVRALNGIGALAQDLVQPLWSWLGAGCHPNRDVAAAIANAGFRLSELERLCPYPALQPMLFQAFVRPHILGVAVPGQPAG